MRAGGRGPGETSFRRGGLKESRGFPPFQTRISLEPIRVTSRLPPVTVARNRSGADPGVLATRSHLFLAPAFQLTASSLTGFSRLQPLGTPFYTRDARRRQDGEFCQVSTASPK